MAGKRKEIAPEALALQRQYMDRVLRANQRAGKAPLALVDTYGCQQNEADSEKLRGMLREMGYAFTDDADRADIVIMNTCAVREHAEMRVLGNVGALTHTKKRNPSQIIALCGCMVQQPAMAEKIRKSYRHVDLVFGPHVLWRFPEFLCQLLENRGRIFSVEDSDGAIAEGLPADRDRGTKAWLSIMYGCNNFCSYCIVPYVRGRERSRLPEHILQEAKRLVRQGCKDITLLGQNVNSYGKDLPDPIDFSTLLRQINAIDGQFLIRFMTSHPKDAGERLFRAMAECEKVAKHIHLPFQSGSSRILGLMNRRYTREAYLELVTAARSLMPEIVLTSDVIVGFPGETEADFEETMTLVEQVRFDALFTFIYSPRPGTPAAEMADPFTREEKQRRFDRLLQLQNRISEEKHAQYVGRTVAALVDGESGDARYPLTARTEGGRLIHLAGGRELIGTFCPVSITGSNTWALFGQPAQAPILQTEG